MDVKAGDDVGLGENTAVVLVVVKISLTLVVIDVVNPLVTHDVLLCNVVKTVVVGIPAVEADAAKEVAEPGVVDEKRPVSDGLCVHGAVLEACVIVGLDEDDRPDCGLDARIAVEIELCVADATADDVCDFVVVSVTPLVIAGIVEDGVAGSVRFGEEPKLNVEGIPLVNVDETVGTSVGKLDVENGVDGVDGSVDAILSVTVPLWDDDATLDNVGVVVDGVVRRPFVLT